MEKLHSNSEVIDKLGGISAVAELTGSKYNTVANWVKSLPFPSKFYVVMTTALRAKGFTAPASLWRMTEAAE